MKSEYKSSYIENALIRMTFSSFYKKIIKTKKSLYAL